MALSLAFQNHFDEIYGLPPKLRIWFKAILACMGATQSA